MVYTIFVISLVCYIALLRK